MGVLSDRQIREMNIVTPFEDHRYNHEIRKGKISWGATSYGYDCRVGYKFYVFSPIMSKEIDPKNFDKNALVEIDLTPVVPHEWKEMTIGTGMRVAKFWKCIKCGKEVYEAQPTTEPCYIKEVENYILIPPHSFVLAESMEEFNIPRDVLCVVMGKSTYARCGLIVNVTPGEPEWIGKWTIELSNTTDLPIRVYCGEGIMQCIFIRSDDPQNCEVSYADKKGKYQNQTGLTTPKADPGIAR